MTIRQLSERPRGGRFLAVALAAFALLGSLAWTGRSVAAAATTVQGVLLDKQCSPDAETRIVSDPSPHLEGGILWAYTHTRRCLLMPACQRSGYGIFTYDTTKYLSFDAAGNQKALAMIQASKKADDMRIEVTGEIDGDKIKVSTLRFLP
jgi:hypothetical protein